MRYKVILAALLSLSVTACDTTQNPFNQFGKNDYPAEVVYNFVSACNRTSGGQVQYCSCAIEMIQRKYTFQEYYNLENRIIAGDSNAAQQLMQTVANCKRGYSL